MELFFFRINHINVFRQFIISSFCHLSIHVFNNYSGIEINRIKTVSGSIFYIELYFGVSLTL